jgi:ATP-binding cassette subfamily C protein CydC
MRGARALIRVLRLALPLWRWMGLAALMGFFTVAGSIGLLATSAWVVAKASLRPSILAIQTAVVAVRFFGVSRGVFRYLERYISHEATFRLLARLRVWFYGALEPLAPARLMHYRSGDLLARIISDVETLQRLYLRVIAPPLTALMVGALMAGLLWGFEPALVPVLLAFWIAAGIALPVVVGRLARHPGANVIQTRATLGAAVVDAVQGMPDALAFGYEDEILADLARLNRRYSGWKRFGAWLSGMQNALGTFLMNLCVFTTLLVAIPRVDSVLLGAIALAVIASFEAVRPLTEAARHLGRSAEAARRLLDVLDANVPVERVLVRAFEAQPERVGYDIVIDDLRFNYEIGAPQILDGFSLALREGERVVITGPSGAGKSTLVNLLVRFWDYDKGRIMLGGRDLLDYRPAEIRTLMGVVPQQPYLFNATVRENLLLARPDADKAAMVAAARAARVHEFIMGLPAGYDTWVGEDGVRLSSGERQRIAIARALLKDAPVLIFDEPTANLDPPTARAIFETIREVSAGRSVLLITHPRTYLRGFGRTYTLRDGKLHPAAM